MAAISGRIKKLESMMKGAVIPKEFSEAFIVGVTPGGPERIDIISAYGGDQRWERREGESEHEFKDRARREVKLSANAIGPIFCCFAKDSSI